MLDSGLNRDIDHFVIILGSFLDPGGVDFGSKKWVEKVEGNKVEKKWSK